MRVISEKVAFDAVEDERNTRKIVTDEVVEGQKKEDLLYASNQMTYALILTQM